MSTPIARDVRDVVDARDGHVCQRCGRYCKGWFSRHHRKSRGMGGSKLFDTPSNIVTLCGDGVRGCHGIVTANRDGDMYKLGWLVRRNSVDDPESIPVETFWGPMYFLESGKRIQASVAAGGSVTEETP